MLFNQRLFTFHDLHDSGNPLQMAIAEGTIESEGRQEIAALPGGATHVMWLLNKCLYQHFMHKGLLVDEKRKRGYFSRTEDGPREISYQARLRRAKRTVVKPRISRVSDKIQYWEHKALSFRFETFGSTLGLMIVPGYVFTWDGWRGLLAADRVTRLSTRRASRDYNTAVHNDLYFWVWVLSGAEESSFVLNINPFYPDEGTDAGETTQDVSGNMRTIRLSSALPTTTVADSEVLSGIDDADETDEDLAALDEELTALAEKASQDSADRNDNGA
jgi:hypothetical protein